MHLYVHLHDSYFTNYIICLLAREQQQVVRYHVELENEEKGEVIARSHLPLAAFASTSRRFHTTTVSARIFLGTNNTDGASRNE